MPTMPNMILRKRMQQAHITVTDIAKCNNLDVKTVGKWLDEPLNKERATLFYNTMDEIRYYRRRERKEKENNADS